MKNLVLISSVLAVVDAGKTAGKAPYTYKLQTTTFHNKGEAQQTDKKCKSCHYDKSQFYMEPTNIGNPGGHVFPKNKSDVSPGIVLKGVKVADVKAKYEEDPMGFTIWMEGGPEQVKPQKFWTNFNGHNDQFSQTIGPGANLLTNKGGNSTLSFGWGTPHQTMWITRQFKNGISEPSHLFGYDVSVKGKKVNVKNNDQCFQVTSTTMPVSQANVCNREVMWSGTWNFCEVDGETVFFQQHWWSKLPVKTSPFGCQSNIGTTLLGAWLLEFAVPFRLRVNIPGVIDLQAPIAYPIPEQAWIIYYIYRAYNLSNYFAQKKGKNLASFLLDQDPKDDSSEDPIFVPNTNSTSTDADGSSNSGATDGDAGTSNSNSTSTNSTGLRD